MKAASQRPPAWIASSTRGASTAAERMRVISKGTCVLQRFRRRAVASREPTEFREGGFEVALVEVGPQLVDEDELAVGRLPEQEVAEPLLAGGADHQVGIGNAGGQEAGGEAFLVDVLERDLAGGDRKSTRLNSSH